MQKIITLIILVTSVVSCSNEDQNLEIRGQWRLLESIPSGFDINSPTPPVDFRNDNIIFSFQNNGILIKTGGENPGGYPDGEYSYFFREEFMGRPAKVVEIDDRIWTFDLSDGVMTLGMSYLDGSDLVFERN